MVIFRGKNGIDNKENHVNEDKFKFRQVEVDFDNFASGRGD